MTGHWPLGDLWPVGAPPVPGLSPGLGWERRGRPPFSEWGTDLGGGKVSWSPCPPSPALPHSRPLSASSCGGGGGSGGGSLGLSLSPSRVYLSPSLLLLCLSTCLHLSLSKTKHASTQGPALFLRNLHFPPCLLPLTLPHPQSPRTRLDSLPFSWSQHGPVENEVPLPSTLGDGCQMSQPRPLPSPPHRGVGWSSSSAWGTLSLLHHTDILLLPLAWEGDRWVTAGGQLWSVLGTTYLPLQPQFPFWMKCTGAHKPMGVMIPSLGIKTGPQM